TVDPSSSDTSYWFEYGTSSLDERTPAQDAGSGATAVQATAPISGLAQGKTYEFRLVARNAYGTTSGNEATLTTAPKPGAHRAPPAGAADVTGTRGTLAGTVDPGSSDTSFWFQYGTSSLDQRTPAQDAGAGSAAVQATAAVQGLEAGKTYVFRLVAQ